MHTKNILAQVLLLSNLLSEPLLLDAIEQSKKTNQTLLNYLLLNSSLRALDISQTCAKYFNLPHRELNKLAIEKLPLNEIKETFVQKNHILPLSKEKQLLHVAIADPDNLLLLEEIQSQTGLQIQAVIVPYDQLCALINRIISNKNYQSIALEQIDNSSQTAAVTFVEQILTDAIHRSASDLHCEPLLNNYRVRMRIDGLLHEITHAPLHLASSITCRLKVMSQCDIAERRLPQDGRLYFYYDHRAIARLSLEQLPNYFRRKSGSPLIRC